MTPKTITLEGRAFRPLGEGSTLEQDDWFSVVAEEAGLSEIEVAPDDSAEKIARRIELRVRRSRKHYLLMGCLMVPVDKTDEEWSPELAAETGDFLRKLRDPVAKAQVREVFLQLLIPFVSAGIVRLFVIAKSSAPAAPDASAKNPDATPASDAGTRWWVRWATGIRTAWRAFIRGGQRGVRSGLTSTARKP